MPQSQSTRSWASSSPDDTRRIAAGLARHLRVGDVVELDGELGSGKTLFVIAAAETLGVRNAVSSPTYTIGNRYHGDGPDVSHLDLYRLDVVDADGWADLEPYFEDAVVFVEWPAAGRGILPAPKVTVDLRHQGGDARLISLTSHDSGLLTALADSLI